MNYISNVVIENFQSHEFTQIDFVNGLNVITGPSDQGKSAILRAIKWVLYNEPRGMEFIRHGANFARVTIELNTGDKIIRERSSSKNRYTLVNASGDTQMFEGFGNEIPKEIISAHGIPKIIVDTDVDTALNISDQLESPFLLFQAGTVRAKALGRLTGAHVIDLAIRNCVTDIRRENQNETRINSEIENLNRSILSFADLNVLQEKISLLDISTSKLSDLNLRVKKCTSAYDKYTRAVKGISQEAELLRKVKNIDEYEKLYESINFKIKTIGQLIRISRRKQDVCNAIDYETNIIASTKNVKELEKVFDEIEYLVKDINKKATARQCLCAINNEENSIKDILKKSTDLVSIYENIDKSAKRLKAISEYKSCIDTVNASIDEGHDYLANIIVSLNGYADNFVALMKKIGKCPMCFNDIDDSTVNKISLNYQEVRK